MKQYSLLLAWLFCLQQYALSSSSKPNIVFILADDLGWQDVGFHGTNLIPTPNIDALAYSGVILNDYYVTPLCSPTRAALMTARHPIHTGMWETVLNATQPYGLGLEEKIFPQYMKDHGYASHIVGKWHLGFYRSDYFPTKRGWDSFFGYLNSRLDYWNYIHASEEEAWIGRDLYDGLDPAPNSPGEYATHLFTRKAIDIVEKHDTSRPLFLYMSHLAVHMGNFYDDVQAPKEKIDTISTNLTYWRRKQAAVISELDDSVGALVEALGKKNILDNTIIVFSTDNGGATSYFPVKPSNNWPFRGGKITTWEGGVRAVGFVWSPLLKNTPRVSKQLLHVQDWIPTLLGSFNEKPTGSHYTLDGINAWSALNDPALTARDEVLHMLDPFYANFSALRQDKWKITVGSPSFGLIDFHWSGSNEGLDDSEYNLTKVQTSLAARVIEKTSKPLPSKNVILRLRKEATLTACPKLDGDICIPLSMKPCLFDLDVDYCETVNVADENPDVVQKLLASIAKHNATVVPSRKRVKDPDANPNLYGGLWVPWYDFIQNHSD